MPDERHSFERAQKPGMLQKMRLIMLSCSDRSICDRYPLSGRSRRQEGPSAPGPSPALERHGRPASCGSPPTRCTPRTASVVKTNGITRLLRRSCRFPQFRCWVAPSVTPLPPLRCAQFRQKSPVPPLLGTASPCSIWAQSTSIPRPNVRLRFFNTWTPRPESSLFSQSVVSTTTAGRVIMP